MIQFTSISRNSNGSWTFVWGDEGAVYYRLILLGQVLVSSTTGLSYEFAASYGYRDFPPPLEVAYEDEEAVSEKFKPFVTIQWYGQTTVKQYLIQQKVSATWTTVARVNESGQWVYTYNSPVLEDGTEYEFRVIAVDSVGNQSTPRNYRIEVVTPPRILEGDLDVTYDSGSLIVSAD